MKESISGRLKRFWFGSSGRDSGCVSLDCERILYPYTYTSAELVIAELDSRGRV